MINKNYIFILLVSFIVCGMFLANGFCILDKDETTNYAYISSKSGLLLREKPDVKSKSIILIPFKSKIIIIEKTTKNDIINGIRAPWYKVAYNKNTGFVFSGYLSKSLPVDESIVIGEYLQEKRREYASPAIINIMVNKKFIKTVNLCHNFGKVFGNWWISYSEKETKYILHLKLTGSDFGLVDKDKVEAQYLIVKNKLVLLKTIPKGDIGCDFVNGDTYIKK